MLDFMLAGGYATWLILLFGLITLVMSGIYLWKPNEKRYAFIRAMSKATLYTTLGGLCAGFAAVMYHVPSNPQWAHSPDLHLIVMEGLGEAFSSPILGFSILGVCWLITAFGERRRSNLGV
jgi:hypothetical protein